MTTPLDVGKWNPFKFMTSAIAICENEGLTSMDVELVQNTWRKIEGSTEFAIDFYNKLFYLYPALRPLFKENIQMQARKVTAHFAYVINNIKNWEQVKPEIIALGRRHVKYEVQPEHYSHVADALFFALKAHLKEDWNSQVQIAWLKFYTTVTDEMLRAHYILK